MQPKRFERGGPAMLFPWNAPNIHLKSMSNECGTKVPAILLDGVGGFVAAAEQSDDALSGHFSTRKLPMTNASIPELKNVRSASVGVWTIASPRRLNEVFMTTGTPDILPNSSINL